MPPLQGWITNARLQLFRNCNSVSSRPAWAARCYLDVELNLAKFVNAALPPKSGGAASNLACAMANNSVVSHVALPFTWRHVRGHFSSVRWEIGKNRSVTRVAPRLRSTRTGKLGIGPSALCLAIRCVGLRLGWIIALRSVRGRCDISPEL